MNAPPSDHPVPDLTPPPPPVQALLEAYSTLSVRALLAPLAEEGFTHRVLPASLGLPTRDRDGFAAHAAGVFGLFAAFAMEPHAVHADAEAGVVVVRAVMRGTLWKKSAARDRQQSQQQEQEQHQQHQAPWLSECVLLLRLTPDRARIAAIDEFVDSAKALEMRHRHAPREFAAGASASSSSSYYTSVLSAWLAPEDGDLVPRVVSGAAQLLAVCVAYQALTRSYSWFLRSEA